jgi:hypothetical protein
MSLNVLVLESDRGAATDAVADLQAAGHNVLRCHDGEAPAFPCRALTDEGCPLRHNIVDVALTVRRRPRSQPAPQEDGVTCALRTHVPLVVAGAATLNPYEDLATVIGNDLVDIVSACERAAAAPLRAHTGAALRALTTVFEKNDVGDVTARVVVHRRHGQLHVDVTSPQALPQPVQNIAAVQIIAALRALDPDARGIDVSFNR